MKVLLLLPYAWDTAPSQRYRIEQWVPILEKLGVRFEIASLLTKDEQQLLFRQPSAIKKAWMLARAIYRRQVQLRKIGKDIDCVFLHRAAWPIGPAWAERSIKRGGVPLIYDFDDAIWLANTSDVNRKWAWVKCSSKTGDICKIASHVIVGNSFLAEYARRFNSNVTIVPPTVELNIYDISNRKSADRYQLKSDSPCTIGWTGSHTTSTYLKIVEPALRLLAKRHDIVLRVIGDPGYHADGVPYELVKWNGATEVDDLRPLDIGIMPLSDHDWTRGKCGMKAIQYMALGIPTVVSPVGFNTELIRHDENGLLADTVDDWVDCLERLILDAGLRQRLGEAGRRSVEEAYCSKAQAPHVFEVIKSVVESAKIE